MTRQANEAERAAMRRIAAALVGGRCGYHVEWYGGPRYVRHLAVVVPHDGGPAASYYLTERGVWEPWAV